MAHKKEVVASNFLWRFGERFGAQIVKLLVELKLARIIAPEHYGSIAILTVFITILNVFVDSGLANSLIQKKDVDDLDYSSVFWFNIVFCIILYALMFIFSPMIATFYGLPDLVGVLRVLGLQIIISGVKNVQQAYVSKNMLFRKFFFATLTGTIGAAGVGLWLAVNDFGIWALVGQQLFNTLVDTVILWITVPWRPKKMFSFQRLKSLFNYGWKLLASALIDTVYKEIRQLIIGKVYSTTDLSFYNRGKQFPLLFVNNINTSLDSVLLPTLSEEQDNVTRVKIMMRKTLKTSVYTLAPFLLGLAFVGEPLIRLLLSETWVPSVPYMRIFCITYMFYPLHTTNLNAIKSLGRSDLFLKLEILKKIAGLILVLITMRISVMAMAYSLLVSSVASQIINSWPNKKLLNYRYIDQLKDILPSILLATVMGVIIYQVQRFGFSDIVTLLIQVPLGAAIYVGGSILFKFESFYYLLDLVKKFLHKA